MNIDKIRFCNKNKGGFLKDSMILYIKKESAEKYNTESIMYDFVI
jgi:hypothetical protein